MFRGVALTSLYAASARVFPEERDFSNYRWEHYAAEFDKWGGHQATFEANLLRIIAHNANPDKDWYASVNHFTDMSEEEFKAARGAGRTRGPMFAGKGEMHKPSGKALPASVDWRDSGVVTATKDQGGCGSCWAFSATETLESHLALATGEPVQKLSPQQIVSCAPNPDHCGGSGGCDGSTQPLAFAYTETAGITTDANYPYTGRTGSCDTSKIDPVGYNSGYVDLPVNDGAALMDAVANQGPVAVSIAAAGWHFQFYGGGVLKNCNDFVMDHAVQLVGYGTDDGQDYWLVRNSWGGNWGEGGYIRFARYSDGNEPCGVDSTPQDGDACAGDTTPRTYCGECAVLSSSSYPTGMSKASTVV